MEISEHIKVITDEVEKMYQEHNLESDELVAIFDIKIAAKNAEKVFQRYGSTRKV